MPWKTSDATKHTKEADSNHLKKIWAAAANDSLKEDNDEGKAIRIANSAVKKEKLKHKKKEIEDKGNKLISDLNHIKDKF